MIMSDKTEKVSWVEDVTNRMYVIMHLSFIEGAYFAMAHKNDNPLIEKKIEQTKKEIDALREKLNWEWNI